MEKFTIRTLADIEAIEKIPLRERLDVDNTYDFIRRGAQIDPDKVALSFLFSGEAWESPVEVPYKELLAKIHQTANLCRDMGVGPEDVATVLLPNLPQTHYALWGAEAAGIVNPINPMLTPGTIRDICNAARTKILFALGEFPGADIWPKVEAIRSEIPTLEAIVRVMGPSDEANGIYGFEETVEKYERDSLTFDRSIGPDEISSLYHTGGTTGTPKLARRTHFNEVFMAWAIGVMGEMEPDDTLMCGLPLFHVNGTTVTGLCPFSMGAHVVLLSPRGYRDPEIMKNFFKIVERYRANFFSSVPTVLSVLLDIPIEEADISSLKNAICGAAPLSVELFQRFEAHSGMNVLEGYGLTEGACASSVNPAEGERRVGSIGIRIPYQEMKTVILDENGEYARDAGVGEIGVIAIRGPNVFKGYVEEAHNKGLWIQGDWLNSGDLGRCDPEGYFWLTGRKKELIIRGGHNIDPATIEEPLYRIPGVQLAAAVGRPDPHAGEVPVAYVQAQEGTSLTGEAILEKVKGEIGERAAIPKEIHVIDAIPLTPVGKIFKPALRWDATRRIYEKELESIGDAAESLEITVGEHKVYGTEVNITVRPAGGVTEEELTKRIKDILSRFTVHYTVTVAS